MKTKTFDWRFFHIFEKTCQAKAVYGFTSEEKLGDKYLSVKAGFGLEGFRETTIKQIITVALLTLEKEKNLSFASFELLAKSILKDILNSKKIENDILKEFKYVGTTNKKWILAQIEKDLKKIYDLINPEDVMNIVKRQTLFKYDLNNALSGVRKKIFKLGKRYSFKRIYEYFVEYQLIQLIDGQHNLIKITHSGIPERDFYFDTDLSITVDALRKNYKNKVFNKIIIYDTVSLKRTVIPFTTIYGTELKENIFTALFIADTNSMHKSFGDHCEHCNQKSICYASLFDPDLRRHIRLNKPEIRMPENKHLKHIKEMVFKIRSKESFWKGKMKDE